MNLHRSAAVEGADALQPRTRVAIAHCVNAVGARAFSAASRNKRNSEGTPGGTRRVALHRGGGQRSFDWRSCDRCSLIHCPLIVPMSRSAWLPSRLIHAQTPTATTRTPPPTTAITSAMLYGDRSSGAAQLRRVTSARRSAAAASLQRARWRVKGPLRGHPPRAAERRRRRPRQGSSPAILFTGTARRYSQGRHSRWSRLKRPVLCHNWV